jgi:hypothetical protein
MNRWTHEVVETAAVDPARVYAQWADVPGWSRWNPDVRSATIDGPFGAGAHISMTLDGGEVIPLRLDRVLPGVGFDDVAELDGVVVRTAHSVTGGPHDAVIRYAVTVTGELPVEVLGGIGQAISADWPATIGALVATVAAQA